MVRIDVPEIVAALVDDGKASSVQVSVNGNNDLMVEFVRDGESLGIAGKLPRNTRVCVQVSLPGGFRASLALKDVGTRLGGMASTGTGTSGGAGVL